MLCSGLWRVERWSNCLRPHPSQGHNSMRPTAASRGLYVLAALILAFHRLHSVSAQPLLSTDGLHRSDLPEGFIFGAGTSAYQVEGGATEGGRGASVWDGWPHIGSRIDNNTTGEVAADEYHRYEEDVELLASLNMDAYRFSISWTRIFPDGRGSHANVEGIGYYNRLINSLLKRGIEPYVTLYHWDLPQALEDEFGGWLDRRIVDHFLRFADACFTSFGDRVKHWFTINEPALFTVFGYNAGIYPPGRTSNRDTEPYVVAHNALLAHGAVVDLYRKKFQPTQNGEIGITVESVFPFPLTNSSEDVAAAQRMLDFEVGWILDPIFLGDYPARMRQNVGPRLPIFTAEEKAMLRGSSDFIGLNHYTSMWATTGPGPSPGIASSYEMDARVTMMGEFHNASIGAKAASEWLYIVPSGMHALLMYASSRYKVPIYVTENGMDYDQSISFEDSLRDSRRVQFYKDYLSAVVMAIREGADVRGYFAWSLLDNFEWLDGYTKCFGLIYVDRDDDLKRYLKDSALWLRQLLRPSGEDSPRTIQSLGTNFPGHSQII